MARRRSTTRWFVGGVRVVANQGAFLDLDGLLGERRVDWRLDDLGHFDHRKVIVVDGRVGYVGGPGIEDHYTTGTHDVMLRLEGPIVAQLQAVFLLSWLFQGGPLPPTVDGRDRFFPPIVDAPGTAMEILLNNPGEVTGRSSPQSKPPSGMRPAGYTSSAPTWPTTRSCGG